MRRVSERDPRGVAGRGRPRGRRAWRGSPSSSPTPSGCVKALRAALLGHGARPPTPSTPSSRRSPSATTRPPRVTLVARPGPGDRRRAARRRAAEPAPLSPVGAVLDGGDPGAIRAVREGRAAVQDEGSQLLALALAAVPVEGAGEDPEQWLDLCAGPGGKAGLLAGLALEAGADLTANEVSEHRTDLVRQTLGPPSARARRRRPSPRGAHRRRPRRRGGRARSLRPRARRRPVHRPGRAAAPARGPLAPARPPTWPTSAGSSASCSASAIDATRPGASSPTPPAARTSPRPSSSWATSSSGGRTSSSSTRGPRWPGSPGAGSRSRGPVRRRSCGRTCTAPTGCSWRCCAAPAEPRGGDARVAPHQPPSEIAASDPGARLAPT